MCEGVVTLSATSVWAWDGAVSGIVKPLHRDVVYCLYSAQLKRNGSPYASSHFSSSAIKDAVGASRRPNKREQVSRWYFVAQSHDQGRACDIARYESI